MTEKQRRALRPGDKIVNKRAPGFNLEVVSFSERGLLKVKDQRGAEHEVGLSGVDPHWTEYQLVLEQKKLL